MAHAVLGREDVDAGVLQEAHGVVHEVLHRHQDVVTLAQAGVRQAQATPGVGLPLHPGEVTVDRARAVALLAWDTTTVEPVLHAQQRAQQDEGRKLGLDLRHAVCHGRGNAIGGLGLVCVAHLHDAGQRDGVDQLAGALQVVDAVAHVGAERDERAADVRMGDRPVAVECLGAAGHIVHGQDPRAGRDCRQAHASGRRVAVRGMRGARDGSHEALARHGA